MYGLQDYGGHSPSIHCNSWVAVTVGSTPELTPLVILTLKYRLSCSPVPEGLHSGGGCLSRTARWLVGHRLREKQDVGKSNLNAG